jgi:hypothetical protein
MNNTNQERSTIGLSSLSLRNFDHPEICHVHRNLAILTGTTPRVIQRASFMLSMGCSNQNTRFAAIGCGLLETPYAVVVMVAVDGIKRI